jgi:hypothetical protein
LACPNGCGQTIKRSESGHHVADVCTHRKVKCEFHSHGCKWFDKEKDFGDHLDGSWRQHIALVSLSNSRELEKMNDKISELTQQLNDLKQTVYKMNISELSTFPSSDSLVIIPEIMPQKSHLLSDIPIVPIEPSFDSDDEVKQKPKLEEPKLGHTLDNPRNCKVFAVVTSKGNIETVMINTDTIFYPSYQVVVDRWNHKRAHNNLHRSSTGCTFGPTPGYNIQLTIHCNGIGAGYGSHVSVYTQLLSNSLRKWLVWPFRGIIVVQLKSQQPDDYPHKYGFIIYDDEVDDEYCQPDGTSLGISQFISFSDIGPYVRSHDNGLDFTFFYVENRELLL